MHGSAIPEKQVFFSPGSAENDNSAESHQKYSFDCGAPAEKLASEQFLHKAGKFRIQAAQIFQINRLAQSGLGLKQ